ncbi:hypothetical protein [Candidatus Electronema sp. PJ]|uniref:hypothetical protein n=1 Tax=Candidatus Electronema sp. PJ TaxID=3401572 RepID=UPI003AA7D0EB
MKELKTSYCAAALCCSLLVSGCGLLDDGRMAAWENVRMKEEETKQKILALREKELAGIPGEDVPTLTVTTRDSNGQPVQVSMNMIPLLRTIVSAMSRDDAYGIKMNDASRPLGQTSESLSATAKVIQEIGSAPLSIVFATGAVMAKGIDSAGERMTANEITVNSHNTALPASTEKTTTTTTTTTNNTKTTTNNTTKPSSPAK